MEDSELIEMIRTGDLQRGWELLAARFIPELLPYCNAITKGETLIGEGLCYDTLTDFCEFIRGNHDADIKNVIGYLKIMARNSLIAHKEKEKRIAGIFSQAYTEDTYDLDEVNYCVDLILHCPTLTKQQREVLCFRYVFNLDIKRIAGLLDTSGASVYVSLSEGRKKLGKHLG